MYVLEPGCCWPIRIPQGDLPPRTPHASSESDRTRGTTIPSSRSEAMAICGPPHADPDQGTELQRFQPACAPTSLRDRASCQSVLSRKSGAGRDWQGSSLMIMACIIATGGSIVAPPHSVGFGLDPSRSAPGRAGIRLDAMVHAYRRARCSTDDCIVEMPRAGLACHASEVTTTLRVLPRRPGHLVRLADDAAFHGQPARAWRRRESLRTSRIRPSCDGSLAASAQSRTP